jgi:hypothetical protein
MCPSLKNYRKPQPKHYSKKLPQEGFPLDHIAQTSSYTWRCIAGERMNNEPNMVEKNIEKKRTSSLGLIINCPSDQTFNLISISRLLEFAPSDRLLILERVGGIDRKEQYIRPPFQSQTAYLNEFRVYKY